MKFNIYINQYKLSENEEISIQEGAVIDWLYTMFGSSSEKIAKKRSDGWTWISLPHLIEEMPLLRIKTNSGASKLLNKIKKMGFIDTKNDKKERKLYAKATPKMRELYFSNPIKDKVQMETARVLKETAQVPQDTNHNTNINTLNNKPLSQAQTFSFSEELVKLGNSKWKPDLIIHNYWKYKHFTFDNEVQFKAERSRNLRPAKQLEGYTSKQINDTMDYCEKNYSEVGWTLETCAKVISRVVNVKK